MFQILIVDDEKYVRTYFNNILTHAGYVPHMADSSEVAMKMMDQIKYDLIILDVMMPGIDGLTFAEMLRTSGDQIPILMVSGKHTQKDINKGLIAGADDYMAKPVNEDEFLLRIKALLRRSNISTMTELTIGSTVLHYNTRSITFQNTEMYLPHKEFLVLYKLLSYPSQIFTRTQLIDEIWGPSSDSIPATVSVHINRLRNRFKDNPDFSIVTIRGLGYKAVIK